MDILKAFKLPRIKTAYRSLPFFPDDAEVPIHKEADIRNLVKGRGEDYLKVKLTQKPDTPQSGRAAGSVPGAPFCRFPGRNGNTGTGIFNTLFRRLQKI
jgi:hypothetical protein